MVMQVDLRCMAASGRIVDARRKDPSCELVKFGQHHGQKGARS